MKSSNGDGFKDPAAGVLLDVDEAMRTENPGSPIIEPEHIPPAPETQPAAPEFLRQAMGQCIDKGLMLSKVARWNSPAIPGVLTEDEWKKAVTETSVQVIQKRWPTIANDATPEFALLVLTLPFVLENTLPWLMGVLFGKGNRDSRSDGNGKNNVNAKPPEPMPADFFVRPNGGSEVSEFRNDGNNDGRGREIVIETAIPGAPGDGEPARL